MTPPDRDQQVEAEPKKAYAVVEWWRIGKSLTVYAHTAEEAKRKVRGEIRQTPEEHNRDVIGDDQVHPTPKGIEVRRDPGADR